MDHFIKVLSFLLIPIIVRGVIAFLSAPKIAEKGKAYFPRFFLILGLICSIIFIIPTFITIFSGESIWIPIIFLIFSLLGVVFIVAYVNCRIYYDKDGFIARNFFGIKRRFKYDGVTAIRENTHEKYIYLGKKKVMVDEFMAGGDEFIRFVKKEYARRHDGQPLPRILSNKKDIFKGHVKDPGGIIFAFVLVSAIIIGWAGFAAYHLFVPTRADEADLRNVVFTSFQREDDEIVLSSSDEKIYKIKLVADGFDHSKIAAISDGKTSVSVYADEVRPEDEDDYYIVNAIYRGDECLLSFGETDAWRREEYLILLILPAIFAVIWGIFIAGTIAVGRNPKKFSKRIRRLFFREGSLIYD